MKRVELKLKQAVKQGHENDYCVRHGYQTVVVDLGGGHKRLDAKARRLSKFIGRVAFHGYCYLSTDTLQRGLAAVCVEEHTFDERGSVVYYDYYENGRLSKTIKEVNGKEVNTTEYAHTLQSVTSKNSK